MIITWQAPNYQMAIQQDFVAAVICLNEKIVTAGTMENYNTIKCQWLILNVCIENIGARETLKILKKLKKLSERYPSLLVSHVLSEMPSEITVMF